MSSIDTDGLNKIQSLFMYTPRSTIDSEPAVDDVLPQPLMPNMKGRELGVRQQLDVKHTHVEEDEEEKDELPSLLAPKENENRAFATLVVLVILGSMLQGKVSNPDIRVTFSAIAMVALPLAYYANIKD